MEGKHSVKLSTQYRAAVKILRRVMSNGESLKTLLFNEKHARTNRLNALLDKFFRNRELIEKVIEKSEILVRESRFDPYVCRILLTELLIGHENGLTGQAKPIQTILTYKTDLLNIFNELKGENFTEKRNVPLPRYVRINTLKITYDDALEECRREGFNQLDSEFETYPDFLEAVKNLGEYDFLVDFHVKHLLVFAPKTRVYWARSPLVAEHKFILQDKASCLPPMLLELPKKSCILDMCAAPGMKTTQMAAIIKNKGKIYANDLDKKRYEMLCENLKNKNVKFIPINRDATELTAEEYPNVEYILVDPSCSSSGMASRAFDKQPSKERIQALSKLQTRLLVHTLQSFPNAKRVVYSTCSIYPEENEYVITKALARCPNFMLLDPRTLLGESWINFGSDEYRVGEKCIYCYEETDLTNGFFCAIFVNKNVDSNGEVAVNQEDVNDDQNEIESVEETLEVVKKKKQSKIDVEVEVETVENTNKDKKKRKHRKEEEAVSIDEPIESPKKKKKKSKDQDLEIPVENEPEVVVVPKPKKKKKKHADD